MAPFQLRVSCAWEARPKVTIWGACRTQVYQDALLERFVQGERAAAEWLARNQSGPSLESPFLSLGCGALIPFYSLLGHSFLAIHFLLAKLASL